MDDQGKVLRVNNPKYWFKKGQVAYLQIRSAWYAGDERTLSKPMTIRVNELHTTDPFEPNGTPAEAKVVAVGRRVRAELTEGDTDIFRYDVADPGTYLVEIDQTEGKVVRWTDQNGRDLSQDRQLVLAQPARVFLRIGRSSDKLKVNLPYEILVLRVGGDPTREPGKYPRHPPPLKVRKLSDFLK